MTPSKWPTELRVADKGRLLRISFDSGERFELPAEYLRVESPSAEVQGHSPAERQYVGGKKDVVIVAMEPVGNYAVKIVFDDLHSTGLYTWEFLYRLGAEQQTIWAAYLAALSERGLSR